MVLPLLALAAPTTVLIVPGHLLGSLCVMVGSAVDAWRGQPERARRWFFAYLVANLVLVAALEVAALRWQAGWSYWALPWSAVVVWGWVPALTSGLAGWVGVQRARRLSRRAVVRRRRQPKSET